MKITLRLTSNRMRGLLFIILCPLCGCADVTALNWLTGEPSPQLLEAKRVVKVPDKKERAVWPNLADVPTQKPAFSSPEARRETNEILVSDKYQAEAESARIRDIALPEPEEKAYKPFSALRP